LKIRQLASRALSLAIAGLLIAVSSATAGNHAPERLRAERFSRARAMDYALDGKRRWSVGRRPMLVRLDYPLAFVPGDVRVRVGVKAKLRRVVGVELYY
jgi:hypothetical protein